MIPSFCGKGYHGLIVHQDAIATGVKVSGCTVHFADATYDTGPIIVRSRTVPVQYDDTPETFAARVFHAECQRRPKPLPSTPPAGSRWKAGRPDLDSL